MTVKSITPTGREMMGLIVSQKLEGRWFENPALDYSMSLSEWTVAVCLAQHQNQFI